MGTDVSKERGLFSGFVAYTVRLPMSCDSHQVAADVVQTSLGYLLTHDSIIRKDGKTWKANINAKHLSSTLIDQMTWSQLSQNKTKVSDPWFAHVSLMFRSLPVIF
jgi:hypothetical protein